MDWTRSRLAATRDVFSGTCASFATVVSAMRGAIFLRWRLACKLTALVYTVSGQAVSRSHCSVLR